MSKIISCQISLIPIDNERYGNIIAQALEKWDTSGVRVETSLMSTVVIGEAPLVWEKVRELFELAQQHHDKIIMQTTFSDCCVCSN